MIFFVSAFVCVCVCVCVFVWERERERERLRQMLVSSRFSDVWNLGFRRCLPLMRIVLTYCSTNDNTFKKNCFFKWFSFLLCSVFVRKKYSLFTQKENDWNGSLIFKGSIIILGDNSQVYQSIKYFINCNWYYQCVLSPVFQCACE